MAAEHPFNYWQEVEVLGFDGEPKYVGIFAGSGDRPGTYAIYSKDTEECHMVPKNFVREKEV